jgi:hypothetical protein
MMLLAERDTDEGLLVSVCDGDVLGDTFEDGDVTLHVDPDFYEGREATEQEVVDSLARCTTANIVGEESVAVAVDNGFVDEETVLDVDGTRHAKLLWL